jgi:hypothetical protein
MVSKIPYIIDLDTLNSCTIQDWVAENDVLMYTLISEGAELLVFDPLLDSVDLLEIWQENEIVAIIELNRNFLLEALEKNMNHWVSREEYLRAARSRDLIKKIKEMNEHTAN